MTFVDLGKITRFVRKLEMNESFLGHGKELTPLTYSKKALDPLPELERKLACIVVLHRMLRRAFLYADMPKPKRISLSQGVVEYDQLVDQTKKALGVGRSLTHYSGENRTIFTKRWYSTHWYFPEVVEFSISFFERQGKYAIAVSAEDSDYCVVSTDFIFSHDADADEYATRVMNRVFGNRYGWSESEEYRAVVLEMTGLTERIRRA